MALPQQLMEGYVRFSSSSPPENPSNGSSHRRFSFQESPSLDSTDSAYLDSPQQQVVGTNPGGSWSTMCSRWSWLTPPPLQTLFQRWRTPSPRSYQSNYMTLVPLSDERLKPRRTKLIVGSVLLLSLLAVTSVFLLVPRGVSVGTIDVHSTKMTFNSTTKTYRIILQAEVPVYNPNYLKASVTGNLTVSFYDAEAGWGSLGPVLLAARTNPQVLSMTVDASNLPRRYTRVVYDQCFAFPRMLVFFLLGTFQTTYLGYTTTLPSVDTYFLLDCSGAQDLADNTHRPSALPQQQLQKPVQHDHQQQPQGQQPLLQQQQQQLPALQQQQAQQHQPQPTRVLTGWQEGGQQQVLRHS